MSGSSARARASAARLTMPPDSSEGNLSAVSGVSPTMSSLASAISFISRSDTGRYSRIGTWMFWRTVSEENSAPFWNSTPHRRSRSRWVARSQVSRSMPHTSTVPARLGRRPRMVRIKHRLAAAGGADEAEDLALPDVEVDARQHQRARRTPP